MTTDPDPGEPGDAGESVDEADDEARGDAEAFGGAITAEQLETFDAVCAEFEATQLTSPISVEKLDSFLAATAFLDAPPAERLRQLAIGLEYAHFTKGWTDLFRIYRHAASLDPDNPDIPHSLGVSSAYWSAIANDPTREKIERDVRSLLEPAARAHRDSAGLACTLGVVIYDGGQHPAEALSWFRDAQAREPGHLLATLYEGHCLADLGRWGEALDAYHRIDQEQLAEQLHLWRVVKLREQIAYCVVRSGDREAGVALFEELIGELTQLVADDPDEAQDVIVDLNELVELAADDLEFELGDATISLLELLEWQESYPDLFE